MGSGKSAKIFLNMKYLKVRLELNNKQRTLALQHCGVARHAWNWGLSLCKEYLDQKIHIPNSIELHKLLVRDVKTENLWYYDVSKCSPQQSLRNLTTAFNKYFKHLSAFPKYKKKGIKDSFYLDGCIRSNGKNIKLPIFGWLKCSEILPDCVIKNVYITRTANDWFVSFSVPLEPYQNCTELGSAVGVDLGLKTLATLSSGVVFKNEKPYKKAIRKLRIAQRLMTKKYVKGADKQSNNYKKSALKVAKIHQKVANIRKDSIHKLTHYLSKNHAQIVIEDLNIKGLIKNRKLSNAILDAGFYEFRRQLEYKCKWYGSILTIVDRFYPSSKTCSNCGNIKINLKLTERIYKCNICNLHLDRDLNAAINLRKMAVNHTVSACGASKKSDNLFVRDAVKQEVNLNNL